MGDTIQLTTLALGKITMKRTQFLSSRSSQTRVEETRSKQNISKCFQEKADSRVRENFLEIVTTELSPVEWLEERQLGTLSIVRE